MNPTRGENRQVVPRWRPFAVTRGLRELGSVRSRMAEPYPNDRDWQFKLWEWKQFRTLPTAISLVEAAVVENRPLDAIDAAEFILDHKIRVPMALRQLALSVATSRQMLNRAASGSLAEPVLDGQQAPGLRVKFLRQQLRSGPRNAVAWVDLSLAYCSSGFVDKAKRAMQIALTLAPNNRFVLRSAVRLYVHTDELDHAHSLLVRSPATKFDPWLSAAEIAIASLAGKPARYMKTARSLIDDASFLPRDLTELTAALGTVELNTGKDKVGKRLLARSIAHPNDNALAQVEWADRTHHTGLLTPSVLMTPLSFEARAWEAYTRSDFDSCVTQTKLWVEDEPFSATPWQFLTYLNSCVLHDYPAAVSTAMKALEINPESRMIRNNLALALARSGETEKAETELNRLSPNGIEEQTVTKATRGLLRFRQGDYEEGLKCYLEAMELARKAPRNPWLSFRASMFLAYELAWASPNSAKEVLELFDNRLAKAKRLGLPPHIAVEADIVRRDIARVQASGDLFIHGSELLEKLRTGSFASDPTLEIVEAPMLSKPITKKPIAHHPQGDKTTRGKRSNRGASKR